MSTQTSLSPELSSLPVPFAAAPNLEGDALTITIAGELDIATVELLEDVQRSVPGSYRTLRYELASLSFIDSAGLRALLAPGKHPNPARDISIANPKPSVLRLLELRGLEGMIVG